MNLNDWKNLIIWIVKWYVIIHIIGFLFLAAISSIFQITNNNNSNNDYDLKKQKFDNEFNKIWSDREKNHNF